MARTAHTSLVASLSKEVNRETRSRGYMYAMEGKVRIRKGNADSVEARVLGTERYHVQLTRVEDVLECSCTCSYVQTEFEPCKHIWATIIEAEKKDYLRAPNEPVPSLILMDETFTEDDLEDSDLDEDDRDEYDDDEGDESDEGDRYTSQDTIGRPVVQMPAQPGWKQQLGAIRSAISQWGQRARINFDSWPADREIIYQVQLSSRNGHGSGLTVELKTRERKKDGEWGKSKQLRLERNRVWALPNPADREILSSLIGAQEATSRYYYYSDPYVATSFVIPLPLLVPMTRLMCDTGRCFVNWSDGESHLLTWDDAGVWELWFALGHDAMKQNYRVVPFLRRNDDRLPLEHPVRSLWHDLVFIGEKVARLEHFGAATWFGCMNSLQALRVPAAHVGELVGEMLSMPQVPKLELPEELRLDDVAVKPRPCLNVRPPQRRGYPGMLSAALAFDYDGVTIPNDDPRGVIVQFERKRIIRRDYPAETAAYSELRRLGFRPSSYWSSDDSPLELSAKHLPRAVRELLAAGWHVQADGKLYRRPGEIKIEVSSGIDWFELHGSVEYGETTVSLPALLSALKKGQNVIQLDDGTFGVLPEEWLKKYGVLAGLGTAKKKHLQFSRSQVGLLDALLASQPEAKCDEVFTRARDALKNFEGIKPLEAPAGFVGELRVYQHDGLGWMKFLRDFKLGGCLADDMGLGKTIQVLALLESRRMSRMAATARNAQEGTGTPSDAPPYPSLVVVPKSLVFNWKQEAARFAPQLRLLDHTGDRTKGIAHFQDFDLVITTYGTLRRDVLDFKDAQFDYVILDEAQAVKNADTESAKAVRLLRGDHRLALSGTPVENHLGELWSLFDFLNPGMLGPASALRLGGAGARNPDPETRELLARAIRPFILRRTKEQVASDLPSKLEQTIYCELEPAQRKLYDDLRDYYRQSLLERVTRDGINKSKIQILEALLRLRQAACHPGLIDKAKIGDSCAKLDVLLPQLTEVVDEGHKVLVFSQFTSLLAIVRQRLDTEKIPYEYLDGQTRDRGARVVRFQTDPNCKVFLISLKAGGLGLNLTAAEYVFLLDPWWNPAVEAQAIDRTHRIGQTRRVFAYRLIARNTVEEKVLALQDNKRSLADAIISADNSLIRNLAREDLELLLS